MERKLARPAPRRRVPKIEGAEDEGRGPRDQRDRQRDEERGRGEGQQLLSRAPQQRADGGGQVVDILGLAAVAVLAPLGSLIHLERVRPSRSVGAPLPLVMHTVVK